MAQFSSLLQLLVFLAAACSLAAAQRQRPGRQEQCSGRTRCNPPPSNDWVSNISVTRYATSARLEWSPIVMPPDIRRYIVIWRNATANDEIFTQTERIQATGFDLENLIPATRYEVLVCRPMFNISSLPVPQTAPRTRECGFCSVCLETEGQRFIFESTKVSRVNETYVNLTCQVESNADFTIAWTMVSPSNSGSMPRRRLSDGDEVAGERVSITDQTLVDSNGRDFTVASYLVAPDVLFNRSVECRAASAFGSRRMGGFQEEDIITTEPPLPSSSPALPVSTIVLVVVVPTLLVTCVVMVIIAACIAYHCRDRNRNTKENLEQRRGRLRNSNQYLESDFVAGKCVSEEKPYDVDTDSTLNLMLGIPEEMIIDNSLINVSTVIGQGEFGVVYKGMLRRGSVSDTVAVKSLKGIFVSENDVQNALKEISKMKNFDHPNVMTLVGVCKATAMSGGAPSIIMPYMARGSLLGYLRKDRDAMLPGEDADITQTGAVQKLLMQICFQISKGMAYLASLRFVHRDLAARNCMIDEKGVIKVADFGLAEDVYMRNYFRQTSQDAPVKLPLKWMAPESIKLGIFSEKSDVWSYGVTCWEVFTAGEIPYPGVHPREVVELLEDGQHLNRPKNPALSDTMYSLINSCWRYRPEDRPEFEELVSSLNKELTTLADYVDLTMFAEENNVNTASEE